MGEDFRFAIVGSGNMGSTYARVVTKLPGMRVVAVVSRSGRRLEGLPDCETVEVADAIRALKTDVDAVILATPNGLHHQGAVEAARLGKHVLTEKVLDVSLEAMDGMIAACKDNGVKLGVVFQRRVSPDNIAVKRLLDTGALGRIFAADLTVKFYRDQAYYDSAPYRGDKTLDGGGPFMQQAAHNIDVYVWFFGMPRRVVSLLGTFAHRMEGEDHGAALLKYDNGMIGTITASTACYPGYPARLEVHAQAGTFIMVNDVITTWDVQGVDNPSRAAEMTVHSGASQAAVSDTAGHERLVIDFVEAVREGREPMVPGESARLATELILKIYDSAQTY